MSHSSSHKQKIIVGLSGGVDSAVAALELLRHGYDVQAVFMKNWEEDDDESTCTAAADLQDAEQVANTLGIKLHTRNFSSEYWEHVFKYFLEEYRLGRTPNPDVLCNKEIKFKTFLEHALLLGADHIATGHYARVQYRDGYYRLQKAVDDNKDQSYFLYLLNQQQLEKTLFPLGELRKSQVRELAEQAGFANHAKKDSTGICFIGERKFKDFLQQYLPAQPGEIQTTDGDIIGQHDGLMYYTLGQRQGLHIGGLKQGSGEPWYVVDKRMSENILVVGQGQHHPMLYSNTLSAVQCHWIGEPPAAGDGHCTAKTRYRQADQHCMITSLRDDRCVVEFIEPQRAVTPGQSVVFYQGDECLGGGIIDLIRVESRK